MEEQSEIENACNGIRTGEQVQKVAEHLRLFPGLIDGPSKLTLFCTMKWQRELESEY
jgi:hypothetical protein